MILAVGVAHTFSLLLVSILQHLRNSCSEMFYEMEKRLRRLFSTTHVAFMKSFSIYLLRKSHFMLHQLDEALSDF